VPPSLPAPEPAEPARQPLVTSEVR
jgi:hypothetical protein